MFFVHFSKSVLQHNFIKGWKIEKGNGRAIDSLAANIAKHKPGWNAKVHFSLFNMSICSKCKMTIVKLFSNLKGSNEKLGRKVLTIL